MQDTRWHSLQGGMRRLKDDDGAERVAISIWGRSSDGHIVGQTTTISPARLERHYGRTLDFIVQSMATHELV